MALKDYALEKGERLQDWEGRPAREISYTTPNGVSWDPAAPGSAREVGARVRRQKAPRRRSGTRGRRRAGDRVRERSGSPREGTSCGLEWKGSRLPGIGISGL